MNLNPRWCPCDDGTPQFCLVHNGPPWTTKILDGVAGARPTLPNHAPETPPRPWWFRVWLKVLRVFGLGDR